MYSHAFSRYLITICLIGLGYLCEEHICFRTIYLITQHIVNFIKWWYTKTVGHHHRLHRLLDETPSLLTDIEVSLWDLKFKTDSDITIK